MANLMIPAAAPMVFSFEGLNVRAVTRDGEPWFVLVDVCRVLEIGNPSDAARRLDEDERHTLDSVEGGKINGLGVVGAMPTIISESGLYSLTLTSRKDAAKRFKKWITSEVLPSIRKTGGYGQTLRDPVEVLNDPVSMRSLLLTYSERVIALQGKADALDRIATAEGSLCITDAAKALQVRPKVLFSYLRAHGWIYRRAGTAHDIGYQIRVNAGDLEHKVSTVPRLDGSEKVTEQVRVTPKGLAKIAGLLAREVAPMPVEFQRAAAGTIAAAVHS